MVSPKTHNAKADGKPVQTAMADHYDRLCSDYRHELGLMLEAYVQYADADKLVKHMESERITHVKVDGESLYNKHLQTCRDANLAIMRHQDKLEYLKSVITLCQFAEGL